jgi:hypothetical protein
MKTKRPAQADDLPSQYNFDYSTAVRGQYYGRLVSEGANVAVLEPGRGPRVPPLSVQIPSATNLLACSLRMHRS